jgi:hypothetical protein
VTSHINTFAAGSFIYYCQLVDAGTGNILVVPLQSSGIPTDAVMQDCPNLQAIFTAGALEATFTNYVRPVLGSSSVTVTTNTVSNTQVATFVAPVFTTAGGALNNSMVKLVIAYQASLGTADSACPVLAVQDWVAPTTGGGLTINVAALTATAT